MGEIIQFISRSERERARLVRKARAIYDNIFPPVDPVSEPQNKASPSRAASGAKAYRGDGILVS